MSAASIGPDQVAYKKKVGNQNGDAIYEVGLIGGLHMIVTRQGKPLGAGPHRAVARHIAKKRNPDVEFTELSKSDFVELYHYEFLLPKWEGVTEQLIEASNAPERAE